MDGPPPGNGEGPRGSGPTPEELTRRGEDKSVFCVAQPCTHPVTCTERFPGGVPHYSHEVCAMCGRHVRWFPKPQTIERRRLNAFRLAKLAMCSSLSAWERGFVRSVSQQKKVSPKQQAIIDRLSATHLEAAK